MSDERRNDKRAIFMLRLASEDFDKKPSPHGLLDYFDGEDEFTESDAIRAALRELDRLTTERDQALHRIEQLYASTVSQGVHDKMVDLYNRAIDERDQAREQLAKLRAACKDALGWLDSSGYGEDHDAITAIEAAARIRAALGTERLGE